MTTPAIPPQTRPVARPQGALETESRWPPPRRGGGKKRPAFGRRCLAGHPKGCPQSSPRPTVVARHTIRTPAVRQSKSKAELMQ